MNIGKYVGFIVVILSMTATVCLWAQIPLLEYRFNETGTVVTNSGSATGNNLILKNRAGIATDLHSPSGSGVTEELFDYAFDNRAGLTNGTMGGVAISSVTPAALAGLRSFTLTGWVKSLSTNHTEEVRLIEWAGTKSGFQLTFGGDPLRLSVNGVAVAATGLNFRPAFTKESEWTFFAVSWDGTLASSNVKFHLGSPTTLLTPSIVTLAQTIVTNNASGMFCVGNHYGRGRVAAGMIDDIRVFGSDSDNSGALTTFQVDYLRQQTVPPVDETIYLSAGTFVNSLTNLLDNDEITFVANSGNDGVLVWDRRAVTPIHDFGLTSRNVSPNAGTQGPPQSWQIEVQANDDPEAITGWSVLAAATNIYGVTDARCDNLGRRVTFEPVTNRYIRWVNTYTGDRSDIASFNIGRQVYVYACSNFVGSSTWPINNATDGDANTFANISAWGDSKTTGLLVLDVLRTNKNDYVTQLLLQHRSDASSDIWPKDYIISVSSTDDPANFDTIVATGQLEQPSIYAPNDKGRWWTIDMERQPKRFFQFEWISAWNSELTAGAQIAEIAVTSINWVQQGSIIILK